MNKKEKKYHCKNEELELNKECNCHENQGCCENEEDCCCNTAECCCEESSTCCCEDTTEKNQQLEKIKNLEDALLRSQAELLNYKKSITKISGF